MSVIPNDLLKPSTSLEMQIFEINDTVPQSNGNGGTYISDFFARHGGFWKSLVIRNLDRSHVCEYRMGQTHPWKTLGPKSERPIQGWGSYFEVVAPPGSIGYMPNIEIDYIGVLKRNAMQ